jgi:hypothetical protein
LGWESGAETLAFGEDHLVVEKHPYKLTDDNRCKSADPSRADLGCCHKVVVRTLCLFEPFQLIAICLNIYWSREDEIANNQKDTFCVFNAATEGAFAMFLVGTGTDLSQS